MDQFMREKKIKTSETMLLCNLITEFILMKVHNMTIQARHVLLNSAHAIVDPILVVCYHAHCSIEYLGCLLIQVVL